MRDNGLEMTPRGNGLVIRADDGTMVKPSTVARELSKPALEKRLGAFEASPEWVERKQAKREYQKKPVRSRTDTTEFYARYKDEQKNLTVARVEALAAAKRRKDRAVAHAKQKAVTKRAAIKLAGGGKVSKELLYSQTSAALRAELGGIHKAYAREREWLFDGHQRRQWVDWLKHEATQGNSEALAALRAREVAQGLKGNTLAAQGKAKPGHAPVIDNITKKGTIIYRAGQSAVRDDGGRLQVSTGADRAGVLEALRLAAERYGDRITVNGTVEFKAQQSGRRWMASWPSRLPIRPWRSAAKRYCKTISARPEKRGFLLLGRHHRRRPGRAAWGHWLRPKRCKSRGQRRWLRRKGRQLHRRPPRVSWPVAKPSCRPS